MGSGNPNSRWVADDDKIRSHYSSSRIEDTESLISCVLFCVLGVFCLFAGLLCFMFCSSIKLSWFWWWSGFIAAFDWLLNENVDHGAKVDAANLVKAGED